MLLWASLVLFRLKKFSSFLKKGFKLFYIFASLHKISTSEVCERYTVKIKRQVLRWCIYCRCISAQFQFEKPLKNRRVTWDEVPLQIKIFLSHKKVLDLASNSILLKKCLKIALNCTSHTKLVLKRIDITIQIHSSGNKTHTLSVKKEQQNGILR